VHPWLVKVCEASRGWEWCTITRCSGGLGPLPGADGIAMNGNLVDAGHFDMSTGAQTTVPFRNFERINSRNFNLTSIAWLGNTYRFELTDD